MAAGVGARRAAAAREAGALPRARHEQQLALRRQRDVLVQAREAHADAGAPFAGAVDVERQRVVEGLRDGHRAIRAVHRHAVGRVRALAELEDALYWVAKGKIKPVIDSVYTIDNAAEAHTKMLKGNLFGKIIMKP